MIILFCLIPLLVVDNYSCNKPDNDTKPGVIFNFDKCPIPSTNTANAPNISITLTNKQKDWPTLSNFKIKREQTTIFIYFPFGDIIQMANSRFSVGRIGGRKNFVLLLSFIPEDDAGSEFEFAFLPNDRHMWDPYCTLFVNDDLTPKAMISRHSPPELGVRDKSNYVEGERMIITCRILKMKANTTFHIEFPQGAVVTKETDQTSKDRISYSLKLTKNIKGGVIKCIVVDGYSTIEKNLLNFQDKPTTEAPEDRTNIAISIAVLFALMLIVMLPIGAYTLIIKQRKDQTKQMVKHHQQEAQTRMQTQMTQMSRMSRMSRMSKIENGEANGGSAEKPAA